MLATLDEFETSDVLEHALASSQIFFRGLIRAAGNVGDQKGGAARGWYSASSRGPVAGLTANQVANQVVEACYVGKPGGDGIHFLGPLAGCVLRVAPPLTMTAEEGGGVARLCLFSLVSEARSPAAGGRGGRHLKSRGETARGTAFPSFTISPSFPLTPTPLWHTNSGPNFATEDRMGPRSTVSYSRLTASRPHPA